MSTHGTARRAVILAAGRGSRLGALTDASPKCLTRVAGRTLLDWMLDALFQSGIEQVLLVGGYGYESLIAHQSPRVATICNTRWSETNMLGTLQVAEAWLAAHSCLIVYSDIAVLPAHLLTLRTASGDIVVANTHVGTHCGRSASPTHLMIQRLLLPMQAHCKKLVVVRLALPKLAGSSWACSKLRRTDGRS